MLRSLDSIQNFIIKKTVIYIDRDIFDIMKNICTKMVRNIRHNIVVVMKIWDIIIEYIETNKIIIEIPLTYMSNWSSPVNNDQ